MNPDNPPPPFASGRASTFKLILTYIIRNKADYFSEAEKTEDMLLINSIEENRQIINYEIFLTFKLVFILWHV
jgi:hypothetical protein